MKLCPCGTQKRYMDCCGVYIQTKLQPETPEILMRSRYSAYVEENFSYIRKTMRGPALIGFDKKNFKENVIWLGLEVIATQFDPLNPNVGYVEFKAKFKQKQNKEIDIIHENSKFEKIAGKWYYISFDMS